MKHYLLKYGVAETIFFSLRDFFTGGFFDTNLAGSGDTKITKDGGPWSNTIDTNADKVQSNLYQLDLTVDELTAAQIKIHIVDQDSPKLFTDDEIIIETYGHASAQIKGDFDAFIIPSSTGLTVGGTWTYTKLMKVLAAFEAGIWRDKSGSPGVQEVLDPDDGSTVVLEVIISTTSPYRTVTVMI